MQRTKLGTHLEAVWVGLGRIGFNVDVDGCCVGVEVLVEVLIVVGAVAFGAVVVLVGGGKAVSVPCCDRMPVVSFARYAPGGTRFGSLCKLIGGCRERGSWVEPSSLQECSSQVSRIDLLRSG